MNSNTRWTSAARDSVLDACVQAGVRRIVVTSSGAAYGYHADNPEWITEDAPLRGNERFAYSWHKRLVEEMLAAERKAHPSLEQVIFRVGTILGESVNNQITALFERPRILVIRGSASPFVFINDRDVVNCLVRADRLDRHRRVQRGRRRRAAAARDRGAARQAHTGAAGRARARGAGGGASARVDPVRAGAGGLPALSAGAGQPAAQGRVRVLAGDDDAGGVSALERLASARH